MDAGDESWFESLRTGATVWALPDPPSPPLPDEAPAHEPRERASVPPPLRLLPGPPLEPRLPAPGASMPSPRAAASARLRPPQRLQLAPRPAPAAFEPTFAGPTAALVPLPDMDALLTGPSRIGPGLQPVRSPQKPRSRSQPKSPNRLPYKLPVAPDDRTPFRAAAVPVGGGNAAPFPSPSFVWEAAPRLAGSYVPRSLSVKKS